MLKFCEFLSNGHSELGLIVDYPQLFSAEKIKMDQLKLDKILKFNQELKQYADTIGAIHLWGKQKREGKTGALRWTAHCGDLNTFFSGDSEKKAAFLTSNISPIYPPEYVIQRGIVEMLDELPVDDQQLSLRGGIFPLYHLFEISIEQPDNFLKQ